MADASGLWIPVLPSMKEFGPALTKGVAKDAEKAGKLSGKTFGLALGAAAATVAGVAAAGTALFNVGKTFQDMTNTIRVGTGAAGKDLEGLVDIAKNVGKQVPHDFDAIGNAVADLNTMMGLTGDDLETVSAQILEAGRMLGEEVDISAVGKSMNAFGVEAEDVSGNLDYLFNVSQATGIGMNELANQARQAAPAAEALGFSFEETAGMIGQLDNAGLDSGKMLQNMSRRMKDVAKDGEEPRDTFNRVAGEISQMVEAGDRFGAQDLAGTAFGTRNAEQFIKALEDGTMNLEDLTGAAAHSGDTIMGLSEETKTFGEHWETFKNTILVALEPVAERVFGGMSDLMENLGDRLTEEIIPAFESFVDWVVDAKGWLLPLGGVLAGVAGSVIAVNTAMGIWSSITQAARGIQMAFNLVMAANPIMLVVAAIAALVAGLVWFFTQTEIGKSAWESFTNFLGAAWDALLDGMSWAWENILKPVFEALGTFFKWVWENILLPVWDALKLAWDVLVTALTWYWENVLKPTFAALGTFFKWVWEKVLQPVWNSLKLAWDVLVTAISWVWENILKPVFQALGTFFNWVWNELLKPAFDALGTAWDALVDGIKWVWENILEPIFQALGDFINDTVVPLFEEGVQKIEEIWEGIKDFAKKPISFVINTVINDGLIPAFNTVAGWIPGVEKLSKVSVPGFAGGGWTGPGGKYEAAGVVHADEFVIRKESQRSIRSVAPGYLDALNLHGAAALDWGKGYADGGLVRPVRGGIVTSGFGASRGRYPHAGIDFAVPTGTPVYAAMPGAVARSGWNVVTGRTGIGLLLAHGGNRNTYYGHLSRAIVNAGDTVSKGQIIGLSGNTGRSTGPHLHWETWTGGKPVNPANVLAGAGLPVSAEGGEGGFDLLGPIRGIGEKISGWLRSEFPGGEFLADAAFGLAKKGFDDLIGWVGDKLNFFSDTGDDNFGGVTGIAGREVNKQNQRGAALPYLLRDKGGNLPTGLSLVLNNTGRDEAILNQRQWSDIHSLAAGDRLSRDDLAELLDITIDNKIILDGKQVFNWVHDEAPRKYRAGV